MKAPRATTLMVTDLILTFENQVHQFILSPYTFGEPTLNTEPLDNV